MRKNWAQNTKSGESCGRARSSPVSPHANERYGLFIYSLFFKLNCTICPEMKKGIAKTLFLDSCCCCYLFRKHLKGRKKSYRPRWSMNKKKKGRKRERKGRAYFLEIGNNFKRLSISRVDAIKTKGTITFLKVNDVEAKDCPCEVREHEHNKVNKNNPADTQYPIWFPPPLQSAKPDLGISVHGSLAYPRPF